MITGMSGPLIVYGAENSNEQNTQRGPSLFDSGLGIADPRTPYNYQVGESTSEPTYGFLGTNDILTLNAIPIAKTTALIAATANTVAGTAMTLQSTSVSGRTVGVSINRADTGALVTGLIELDPPIQVATASIPAGSTVMTVTAITAGTGNNAFFPGMVLSGTSIVTGTTITSFGNGTGGLGTYNISTPPSAAISGGTITGKATGLLNGIAFGASQTVSFWNPAALLGRAVSITSTTGQVAAATFTVRGFDIYGYPLTEVITMSGAVAGVTLGKKAFKYIKSVTPNTTDATNTYSVDTTDIIGLPLRSDTYQIGTTLDVWLMMNNATIASATGYTAADKTVPTATTGDVRGTYALQTASNGTLRFVVNQSPPASAFLSAAGLFGLTNFSDF